MRIHDTGTLQTIRTFTISTGNAKTGPSLSMPEGITCGGKTVECVKECYGQHNRMPLPNVKAVRYGNLKWWTEAQQDTEAAVAAMVKIIREARTKPAKRAPRIKTLRIHDLGDFMSPKYTRAWTAVCATVTDVDFWAYTRSWAIPAILAELKLLAKLPNVRIWISADQSSWLAAMAVYRANPEFAGIAFMAQEDTEHIAISLASQLPPANLVIFPVHRHFSKVFGPVLEGLPNCPAVTHEIPSSKASPACLACRKCLPA